MHLIVNIFKFKAVYSGEATMFSTRVIDVEVDFTICAAGSKKGGHHRRIMPIPYFVT
jgi:hypothetical protein